MSTPPSVDTTALLEAVRHGLVPLLLPAFHSFRDELIAEHAKDVGHDSVSPASGSAQGSGVSTPLQGTTSAQNGKSETSSKDAASSGLSTTKVTVDADLGIQKEDLWDLLTNPGRIPMWTRAPAQVRGAST